MSDLICPVCGSELDRVEKALKCCNNHSFDIARQGYVNLLMSNKSSLKHHGDDKLMVNARRDFLDKGYYEPLRQAVIQIVTEHAKEHIRIVDSGCGDCWYTAGVYQALNEENLHPQIIGIDISKDALIAGGRRCSELTLCVASASRLPVRSESADAVLNIFSPLEAYEFSRILSPDGFLIRAVPMERHLWSLKQAVYDSPYENPPVELELSGFALADATQVKCTILLPSAIDIQNLFKMTPYYYKTGEKDQQKLSRLDSLKVELEVMVAVYKKCK